MGKIYIIDLSTKNIVHEDYDIKQSKFYGRSLATYLVSKYTENSTDRLDEDNVVVLTPGLFTGTTAPSTGRITIATKKGKGLGLQVNNMTGGLPQKLASLGIDAIVIKGKSQSKNAVLYIDSNIVEILELENLNNQYISHNIDYIRKQYGKNCSIIGTGIVADNLIPISTLFSTYPNGIPEYYCTRNGIGDVFGSKGLKLIVVNHDKCFDSKCFDNSKFNIESKKLAKLIIDNPICGQALPGYGSITLIKLLKNKNQIQFDIPKLKEKIEDYNKSTYNIKLNKTCAPLCVIGCLNRHCSNSEDMFSAPAESEVNAALTNCFNINDSMFAKKINTKAFEIGIDSTEFVFTSNVYFKALNKIPTKDEIFNLLNEIENNTIIGKVIGSKTAGVYSLFRENDNLKLLVTKPVINEEKNFKVVIDKLFDDFKCVDDMEFMYDQIFILENLGFCIFTSFALINNKEALKIMCDMYYYKTGIKITPVEMIKFSQICIENELKFESENALSTVRKNIPEFTKVLYRYFG